MVGNVAERDPHLFAVQYPIVAIALRVRTHPDDVAAGVRLGQAKRRDLFAFCLVNKVLLFLLFGAPTENAKAVEADMNAHCYAKECVARFEFFTNET